MPAVSPEDLVKKAAAACCMPFAVVWLYISSTLHAFCCCTFMKCRPVAYAFIGPNVNTHLLQVCMQEQWLAGHTCAWAEKFLYIAAAVVCSSALDLVICIQGRSTVGGDRFACMCSLACGGSGDSVPLLACMPFSAVTWNIAAAAVCCTVQQTQSVMRCDVM
jgi:hypothetical protein